MAYITETDELQYHRDVCADCCQTDKFVTSIEDEPLCARCGEKREAKQARNAKLFELWEMQGMEAK